MQTPSDCEMFWKPELDLPFFFFFLLGPAFNQREKESKKRKELPNLLFEENSKILQSNNNR